MNNTYSERISDIIEGVKRHRAGLDKLNEEREKHFDDDDYGTPEEYTALVERIYVKRKQITHLHSIIGQFIVDDITGDEYE